MLHILFNGVRKTFIQCLNPPPSFLYDEEREVFCSVEMNDTEIVFWRKSLAVISTCKREFSTTWNRLLLSQPMRLLLVFSCENTLRKLLEALSRMIRKKNLRQTIFECRVRVNIFERRVKLINSSNMTQQECEKHVKLMHNLSKQ